MVVFTVSMSLYNLFEHIDKLFKVEYLKRSEKYQMVLNQNQSTVPKSRAFQKRISFQKATTIWRISLLFAIEA